MKLILAIILKLAQNAFAPPFLSSALNTNHKTYDKR